MIVTMLARLLNSFYHFEKRMPPWLKRVWVPYLLFALVVAVLLVAIARLAA